MQYFFLVEWAATFVESLILLCTITAASGRRYEKSRHCLAMLLSTVCLTVLINVLNAVSIFSFLTPIISMCFVLFVRLSSIKIKPFLQINFYQRDKYLMENPSDCFIDRVCYHSYVT